MVLVDLQVNRLMSTASTHVLWEAPEYVWDAAAQGLPRTLFLLGHAASEEPGMKYVSELIKRQFPEIPVHFIPSGPLIEMI